MSEGTWWTETVSECGGRSWNVAGKRDRDADCDTDIILC